MTTRLTKPARRIVYGGHQLGDMLATLRYGGVILKPKGKRAGAQVFVAWSTIYDLGIGRQALKKLKALGQKGGT